MNRKDISIAQAALGQISKYGWRKTTMQDVADAASISRQTLYNHVPNKDELLRLVAQVYFSDNLSRCAVALESTDTLAEGWQIFLDHFVIEVWRTINAIPEAEDFERSANAVIAKEIQAATDQKIKMVIDFLIVRGAATLSESRRMEISRFFYASSSGVKVSARDEAELLGMVSTLKSALIALSE